MEGLPSIVHATSRILPRIELTLDPADAAVLWRAPAVMAWRRGRRVGRGPLQVIWHDTAQGALADAGLIVTERRQGSRVRWRLEGLFPSTASGDWGATLPAPVIAEASKRAELLALTQQALGHAPDDAPLTEVGRFEGEVRRLGGTDPFGLAGLSVAAGMLFAADRQRPACRVTVEGREADTYMLAATLVQTLRLGVPRASLAAEAAALRGAAIPPRHLGAPVLPPTATMDDALATLLGQLGDVLLHWACLIRPGAGEEPVHQMRVAMRRLRSAIKLFDRAANCPALEAAQDALRTLAQTLGGVRDWDVFLAGLGRTMASEFPRERAVTRMLAAGERQRRTGYAVLAQVLEGPEFRHTGLLLAECAATHPWRGRTLADDAAAAAREAALQGGIAQYARHALRRRMRDVLRAGHAFGNLGLDELHALRIRCKRLRYACELFAPAFPGRAAQRFARRLATLQDRLGHLNDGAVASGLLAQLGGGAGRALATGLVRGYVAAREGRTRERAERSWRRFRQCAPFWD